MFNNKRVKMNSGAIWDSIFLMRRDLFYTLITPKNESYKNRKHEITNSHDKQKSMKT